MNNGDLVKGEPVLDDFREEHPVVVGRYQKVKSTFAGNTGSVELVIVKTRKGTPGKIDCRNVELAERGTKETVI